MTVADIIKRAMLAGLGAQEKAKELAGQAKAKLEQVKGDAEKAVDSARARVGISGKDSKKRVTLS